MNKEGIGNLLSTVPTVVYHDAFMKRFEVEHAFNRDRVGQLPSDAGCYVYSLVAYVSDPIEYPQEIFPGRLSKYDRGPKRVCTIVDPEEVIYTYVAAACCREELTEKRKVSVRRIDRVLLVACGRLHGWQYA